MMNRLVVIGCLLLFMTLEACQNKDHKLSKKNIVEMLKISLADSVFYSEMNVNEDSVKIDKIQVSFNWPITDTIIVDNRIYYINDKKKSDKYKYAVIKANIEYSNIKTPEITLRYFPVLAQGRIGVFRYILEDKRYILDRNFFGYIEQKYPENLK